MKVDTAGRVRDASNNYGVRCTFPNGKSILVVVPDLELEKFKDVEDRGAYAIDISKPYDREVYDSK